MRRSVDIAVTVVAGLFLAPLILLIISAILVCMGRPVLFRQARTGLEGRVFQLVKFRSMNPARFHGDDEHERTPALGAFLRASSLDELPQLWNILRGDMSLIGPRPALPIQVEHYTPTQRGRLAIRPGLTGWAQVNGRNAISWARRIELDLWYIAARSLALDVKIVLLTVARVLRPTGIRGADGVNEGFRTASGLVIDVWGARPTDSAPAARPDVADIRNPRRPSTSRVAERESRHAGA